MKSKSTPTQRALNVWAVILIIWAVYRANFGTSMPVWFDEFIAKPAVFILPVYYYISRIEKKRFFEQVGLGHSIGLRDIAVAGLLTVIFCGFLWYARSALGLPASSGMYLVWLLVLAIATAISEQILATGFILHRLYDESKNVITAPFFSSILFFFLHIPILFTDQRIVGYLLLRIMLTDVLLSLSISFMYVARRNLLYPIIIHTFYNLSIYFLTI